MVHSTFENLVAVEIDSPGAGRRRKWWVLAAAVAAIVVVGAAVYLQRTWPFTQANVIQQLEQATSSSIHVTSFRSVLFPHPGCVAEGVTFERGTDSKGRTTLTVEKLVIEGTFTGLFTKHVAAIRAQGAHARFPPFGTAPSWKPTPSDVVVDELTANGALLEFARHSSQRPPVTFVVREFVGHHLAARDPMKFELRLHNPTPPGEVRANGSFGPWKMDQVSATPVAGSYSFRDADLGVFEGIRGILASDGQFHGTLENITVEGATTMPAFEVKGSSHKIGLQSQFHASVDAANGNVTLDEVQARMLRTTVVSRGSIAGRPNQEGKTAALDLSVRSGRIQDLLLLFVSEKQSPLNGVVSLKARTSIPPGNKPFMQRIRMTGTFGIESALFTKQQTQDSLEKLSASARGQANQTDDPQSVLSDLQGRVVVRNGVATFSDLRFRVPGARARVHGTFDLTTQKVDLHGMLFMDATLPKATSGIKSFLLKAIDPFLKKNRRGGAKIPVSITGTYQHPSYNADPV
ncbi:MAG: AsmA-like C-terminal region-containing protein [Terriglobales bacterium]